MRSRTEIYCDILRHGILIIRNRGEIPPYILADLLHNIPGYVRGSVASEPSGTRQDQLDRYFVRTEYPSYVRWLRAEGHEPDSDLVRLVAELEATLHQS